MLPPGSVDSEVEFDGFRRDWQGSVMVEGDIGDYRVSASTNSGRVEFDVSTDTDTDMTNLNGLVDGRISVYRDGVTNELSLGIADAGGPAYLFEAVAPTALSQELFGGNFIRKGNDIGQAQGSQTTTLDLFSVLVGTDDGQVEAFPGTPIEIEVNRVHYRFTLLGAWDRTVPDNIVADCTYDSLMSFEVVRVERETAVTEVLERGLNTPIDGGDCLPIGG